MSRANNGVQAHARHKKILDLAKDALSEMLQDAGDENQTQSIVDNLQKAVRDFRLEFGDQESRGPWLDYQSNERTQDALEEVLATGNQSRNAYRSFSFGIF